MKVYEFNDPVDFLNSSFQAMTAANPRYSLRAWALAIGLPHVSVLSMVLNRKRRLLPSLSTKISQYFIKTGKLNETESRYFDILVMFSNAATPEEKIFYERILSSLRPDRRFAAVELDHFRIISEWYHLVILEMTQLKDFTPDPRGISLLLGGNVNEGQVRDAIERLIRVGLLERTADGDLRKATRHYATPTGIPDEGIRHFHSQMIQRALNALTKQSVHERDITGHTLTIDRSKLPEAKGIIRDFRKKLAEFLETPNGDGVYQLNVQLFNVLGE